MIRDKILYESSLGYFDVDDKEFERDACKEIQAIVDAAHERIAKIISEINGNSEVLAQLKDYEAGVKDETHDLIAVVEQGERAGA